MNDWISVEDRLPDESGYYLTLLGNTDTKRMNVYRWKSIEQKWMGAQVGAVIVGITHWMPLPSTEGLSSGS